MAVKATFKYITDRAFSHRLVAGLTLFAAAVVFISGAAFAVYQTLHWRLELWKDAGIPQITMFLTMNTTVIASLYYLAYLMAITYRYNIRLSGHYAIRAFALSVARDGDNLTVAALVRALDANSVSMDVLPAWKSDRAEVTQKRLVRPKR